MKIYLRLLILSTIRRRRNLAFLEQYGNDNGYSSDEGIGSDLEDTIMSMVQYGYTNNQINTELNGNGSIDNSTTNSKNKDSSESNNNTIVLSDNDKTDSEISESDSSISDQLSDSSHEELPQITRHIDLDLDNLNQSKHIDEVPLDDNEKELNKRLQELIDRQIIDRQRRGRRPLRYCQNCYLAGHIRHECPTCSDCGDLKHDNNFCPGILFCSRCKEPGHYIKDCINDKRRSHCKYCKEYSHASQYCPTLIHIYTENDPSDTKYKNFEMYCYNCGDEGHLGDDCPELSNDTEYRATVFSSKVLKYKYVTPSTDDESNGSKGSEGSDNESNNSESDSVPKSTQPSSPSSQPSKKRKKNRKENYNKQNKNYKSNEQRRYRDNNRNDRNDRNNRNDSNDYNKKYKSKYNNDKYKSGNNNWKALSQQQQTISQPSSSLPRPSRSGYMDINRNVITDFPRNDTTLPKPTRTGYTNTNSIERRLPTPTRSGNMDDLYRFNSKSRYKGGYRRN
ncbi:unnamed protein product [Cunninghamella blakesleeana]